MEREGEGLTKKKGFGECRSHGFQNLDCPGVRELALRSRFGDQITAERRMKLPADFRRNLTFAQAFMALDTRPLSPPTVLYLTINAVDHPTYSSAARRMRKQKARDSETCQTMAISLF